MGKKARRKRQEGHASDGQVAATATPAQPASYHFAALSGLRGLAALGVFCLHAYGLAGMPQLAPGHPELSFLLAWPMRMGWSGVDVFFTLSAFLLALPFARAGLADARAPDLRDYAEHRALRILPAYAVQLLVLFALVALGASSGLIDPPLTPGRLLVQPLFAYDLGWPGVATAQLPLIGSWWTLPVEIAFYLLLPWLARLLRPRRWCWLLLAIPFAWGWRALLLWKYPPSMTQVWTVEHLPGRIDQFAIGMLAAYAFVRAPRVLDAVRGRVADGLFLLAAVAFLLLPALGYVTGVPVGESPSRHPLLIGWHTYASLAAAAMLVAAARGAPLVARIVGCLPLRMLGHVSYGFYLWHVPVLLWLRSEGGAVAAGGPFFFILDGLLFSLVAAMASWWFVERPAMRFAQRRRAARMAAPFPASAP